MSIEVDYKGTTLEFDSIPTKEELEARYKKQPMPATVLRFPVPEAPHLKRDRDPYRANPLVDRRIGVGSIPGSSLLEPVVERLDSAGGAVYLSNTGDDSFEIDEQELGLQGRVDETDEWDGLVYDASEIRHPEGLDRAYEFFHSELPKLKNGGHAVIVHRRPEDMETPGAAAAQRALDGFTRSLAKQLGPSGATSNRLAVETGAEEAIGGPLLFFISDRCAFATSQPLEVTVPDREAPDGTNPKGALEGKLALITGTARGIGHATARRFAQEGAEVACVDLPDVNLEEAIEPFGGIPVPLDVSSPEAPDRLAEFARERGGFDIVVQNAGIFEGGVPLQQLKEERWDRIVGVDLEAPVRITETLVDEGLVNDSGRILVTSSINGLVGAPREIDYCTSKAGVLGLVRNYPRRLAERGITVNSVAPGFIATELSGLASVEVPETIGREGWRLNSLCQGGEPIDIANAMTFLATPAAQGINGEVLRVCGDLMLGA